MTAAGVPARSGPARSGRSGRGGAAGRWPRLLPGRLLRLELRRSAMLWILPLIAALFWFDSFRGTVALPPLWSARMFYAMAQGHVLIDFGPFVAGVAAWMASREGRRRTTDLVAVTAAPRWTGRLVTWAATTCWALAAYLACVGVLYAFTAQRVGGGAPPWWPAAVGAAGVVAFSAAGFAAGAFFPGRFAAALAAFGAFLALLVSSQASFRTEQGSTSTYALILPVNSQGSNGLDSGVFYPYLPDVPIARLMVLAGLAAAALGLLGLPAASGGRRLRRVAAAVTVAGLLAAGTGVGLAGTARLEAHGEVIPALHDAASDRLIPYTPVCSHAAVPVCLHPDYRSYLPTVTAALDPVLSQVAGLPGAPLRVAQVATTYRNGFENETITGSPPVLRLPLADLGLPGLGGTATTHFIDQLRLLFVHAFVGIGTGIGGVEVGPAGGGSPAQQVVQAALLLRAGMPLSEQPGILNLNGVPGPQHGSPAYPAAARFAALPAATRHAWLTADLSALRAGHVALRQLP
jgi:hypothetical protein